MSQKATTPTPPPAEVVDAYRGIYNVTRKVTGDSTQAAPAFFMFKDDKSVVVMLEHNNDEEKEACATAIRIAAETLRPDFTIYVTEAWLSKARPGVDLKTIRPSQDPHRLECVMFAVAYKGGMAMASAPICRANGGAGRCLPDDPPELEVGNKCEGRFCIPVPV